MQGLEGLNTIAEESKVHRSLSEEYSLSFTIGNKEEGRWASHIHHKVNEGLDSR